MVLAIGRCASLTSLLLVLSAMSTLVRSQAPGDATGSCTKPAVPDGVFMLLDAGWYQTLLTGGTGSAGWTQTPAGSWEGKGSFCTRRLVSSCDVSDAWVVTQYINKSAVVNYAINVSVAVEGDSFTSGTIKVHYFPSDGPIASNAQLNTANYNFIKSVPYTPSSEEKNVTFNLGSQYDRFYIAIEVENTCFTLRGLKVSYKVCHRDPEELVVYPDTPVGTSAATTSAKCTENAIVSPGSSLSITCNTDGTYSGSPSCTCGGGHFESGQSCQRCAAGYFAVAGDGECTECPTNTNSQAGASECDCNANFYRVDFHDCPPCPANSISSAGSDSCTCVAGYYRIMGERLSDPCTTAPGKVTDLTNSSRTNTSVTLSWTAPTSDGGRTDLFYNVHYKILNSSVEKIITGIETNMFTVIGLDPVTTYVFVVVAGNGVTEEFSGVFPEVDRTSDEVTVMTKRSPGPQPTDPGPTDPGPTDPGPTDPGPIGPSKPTGLRSTSRTDFSVSLRWNASQSSNGRTEHVFYTIRYKTAGCEFVSYATSSKLTDTSATVSGLSPMTTYTFVVVAGDNVTEAFPDDFPLDDAASRTSNERTVSTKPSFKMVGPVMVWRASSDYGGGILSYDIAVTSKAGSSVLIKKEAEDFHHLLSREDVPANLSGASTVIVQLRAVTEQGVGEWSAEKSVPVTVLTISDLISSVRDPEPRISFINNSPIVNGRNVTMHLATNYDVTSLKCLLRVPNKLNMEELEAVQDCSSGTITYTNLPSATYKFRAMADLVDGSEIAVEREFRPDNVTECNVHLVNDGVTVSGSSAVIEFASTGVFSKCKLAHEDFKDCTSPYQLDGLSSGSYFFKITPQGCGKEDRYPLKLLIEVP